MALGPRFAMNSKNRVKEDLRPVPFADGGVLAAGLKPPIGLGFGLKRGAPEKAAREEQARKDSSVGTSRRSKRSISLLERD